MKTVAFFVRHFTERGTEISIYNYARYNEEILGNKSYIVCFNTEEQKRLKLDLSRHSVEKFSKRFTIIEISNIKDMTQVIEKYNINLFYTLTHGSKDFYEFHNKNIWRNCKTIKHCVSNMSVPEADFFCSISPSVLRTNRRHPDAFCFPHIVQLPNTDEDLRKEMNISPNATIFGGLAAKEQFSVEIAQQAVIKYADSLSPTDEVYFLFMNIEPFCSLKHPRIKFLQGTTDDFLKTKFINTCDAMIHASKLGETFGLAVGEFSSRNKPVITCRKGSILEHLNILNDKALIYSSVENLIEIMKNIKKIAASRNDWNAYRDYSPEKVMNVFKEKVLDKI